MNNFTQVDQTTWVKRIKSLQHTAPKLTLQDTVPSAAPRMVQR